LKKGVASDISNEEIDQLKNNQYIEELDATLKKQFSEEKSQLSLKIESLKKSKIELESLLTRAKRYKKLLGMKKNPLRIIKKDRIQKYIDILSTRN